MSSYLSVNLAELQALAGDLSKLIRALESAMASAKTAKKTASWKGPAAERYRSEMNEHQASLERALDEVREGLVAVKRDITLANEAKALERERLERLRRQEAEG